MAGIENILGCGATAAGRLAVHDPKIAANFEIPLHIGKLIASWDNPEFVAAANATHMRDDDYVVGIEYKGHFRAYPLWITDNYHMINDQIAGEPILFSTCERCQSGSAFMSKVGGQAAKFSAMGMYNASLTMVNRRPGRGIRRSLWLHYEGVAIDGPEKGSADRCDACSRRSAPSRCAPWTRSGGILLSARHGPAPGQNDNRLLRSSLSGERDGPGD
jgi:hypothetical protein